MLGTVTVNLRSGRDGFALVPFTRLTGYWHKKVVHSGGPKSGERPKEWGYPCMHKGIPTAVAEGLHNALDRVGR